MRQRQKDTVHPLLQGSKIREPELFEFVYQQMAGKEIDVDILQLLIQHDASIRGSNSRTGRDRGCLWELAFSQSASFQSIS